MTEQPHKRKLLFVCLQNRLRSPTAEKTFSEFAHLDVRSAGLDKDSRVVVSRELLEWADIIFVMEKRQRNLLQKKFKDIYARKRIVCLYIPDEYDYMDPDLIDLLKAAVTRYL
jgi:predicted protein tyrosine phosphatase